MRFTVTSAISLIAFVALLYSLYCFIISFLRYTVHKMQMYDGFIVVSKRFLCFLFISFLIIPSILLALYIASS